MDNFPILTSEEIEDGKIIVIDKFDLHSVSLTSQGYGVAGRIVSWHTENKESHGHEREASTDDGEVRSPE